MKVSEEEWVNLKKQLMRGSYAMQLFNRLNGLRGYPILFLGGLQIIFQLFCFYCIWIVKVVHIIKTKKLRNFLNFKLL